MDVEVQVCYSRYTFLSPPAAKKAKARNTNEHHGWTKRPSMLQDPILLAHEKE